MRNIMNTEGRYLVRACACIVMVLLTCLSSPGDLQELGQSSVLASGLTLDPANKVQYTAYGESGLTVSFSLMTYPLQGSVLATVLVDDAVENSPFKGDFIAAAINTISLNVTGTGTVPGKALLELRAGAHKWYCPLDISSVSGETQVVQVPLTLAAGWYSTNAEGSQDALFAEDLQNVTRLSVLMKPGLGGLSYFPAQSFSLDDFVLINDDGISSPPATLSPLERSLIARFGYGYGTVESLTEAMKQWDQDADGMEDFIEILSENDLQFALSIFSAENIEFFDGIPQITWTCVAGANYTVVSASQPAGPYAPVSGLSNVIADETGYMTRAADESSVDGPVYYRIVKHL